MKTLYLHIGTPKTGTTSLQNFCYSNREIFEKFGYCYPILPFSYFGKRPDRNALFLNGVVYDEKGKRDLEEEERRMQAGFDMVREAFETFDNVFLSDEAVWMTGFRRKSDVWKRLREESEKGGYTVKIVVYLRRQDEFVESWWNQRVKIDLIKYNTMKWEEFLADAADDSMPDYYSCLSIIAGELGKENIIVRRFARSEFEEGSIQHDFMNVIGLGWSEEFVLPEEKENLNARLKSNAIEVKRVINTIPELGWADNHFFRSVALMDTKVAGEQYPSTMFSEKEARAYVQRFEESNRKVVEEYIKDGRPLFSDKYSNLPKWDPDNPYLYEDIIRFMAISDRKLLHKVTKLENDNRKKEKEIRALRGQIPKLEKQIPKLEKQIQNLEKQIQKLEKQTNKLDEQQKQLKEKLKHPFKTVVRKIRALLLGKRIR